ncbi:MAG: ABC transporter permease subunit/CPBP intramembrane protease [Aeoliella sp.]
MNWRNVKLVWRREIRDQLRDRRTLLVIGVLPLLIYPMMGIVFFRVSQFMQHHDARVAVIGSGQLSGADQLPPLVEGDRFDKQLFSDPALANQMHVELADDGPSPLQAAHSRLANGEIDVIVYFPPEFAERLRTLRLAIENHDTTSGEAAGIPPRPVVFYNSTRDESQLAQTRVQLLLDRWEAKIVSSNLAAGDMPPEVTEPFEIKPMDVATDEHRQAALWSKLLPFIVFICALTGAFYPAVDLCAGEKERGTLETLLTSPAQRSEIVGGKLLTVITFSIGSALCNLASMALTGHLIIRQINSAGPLGATLGLEPPSLASILWLVLALLPMAAFFSAASLALAALARSSKEGQYYLMPMFLVCMPLMLMPLSPGFELNLGTSLIPITGMVLLMRAAMEGDLILATKYVLPVGLMTAACCVIATRWAIDQFKQESVLFRDTENVSLLNWARHAYRHRPSTPSLAAAITCVAAIFFAQFGVQSLGLGLNSIGDFIRSVLISQISILVPVALLTWACVRSPRRTFLLSGPIPVGKILLAVILAVALVPLGTQLMEWLVGLFPLPAGFLEAMERLQESMSGMEFSLGWALLLMAVLPAICEEIAFRGFILSGLRSRASVGLAIVLSSVFFGLAHSTAVHQMISATLLGLVLAYIAVKTDHISPCVAFHMSYNGLHTLRAHFASALTEAPLSGSIFRATESPIVGVGFTAPVIVTCGLASLLLLWLFGYLGQPLSSATGISEATRPHLPPSAPVEESGA